MAIVENYYGCLKKFYPRGENLNERAEFFLLARNDSLS